jgi:DnaJ-class molecular chaperone
MCVLAKCSWCDGTSADPVHTDERTGKKKVCRVCLGVGFVLVHTDPTGALVKCALCKGTGVDVEDLAEKRKTEVCRACYGAGWAGRVKQT